MNSEELEESLRSEFESYLKGVLAELRQEATEFQSTIQAEFDKQKTQFDDAFKGFVTRFDSERTFDEAFRSSVAEHLNLSRDEGAKIAANAMVEAEKLGQAMMPPAAPVVTQYDAIRDAVSDISSKDSQSAILKSLIHHAAEFAPRGAFFIIKSEHFSGWKVFGADDAAENAIRDIHFPVAAETILGAAINAKSTVDNSQGNSIGDAAFLRPLEFGEPERMYAIPLVARGRGVAVLYTDYGVDGTDINRDALETLVRVAGLTVELLASMQTAKAENRTVGAADFEDVTPPAEEVVAPQLAESQVETPGETTDSLHALENEASESFPQEAPHEGVKFDDTVPEMPVATVEEFSTDDSSGFAFSDSGFPQEVLTPNPFDAEPAVFDRFDRVEEKVKAPPETHAGFTENPFEEAPFEGDHVQRLKEADAFEPEATFDPVEMEPETDAKDGELIFDTGRSNDPVPVVRSPFDQPTDKYEPAAVVSGSGFGQQIVEPVIEAPVTTMPQPRLRDRPVDLPIEVPEEDRRVHNDARRFARLLVSEIKLYNEKKVLEGRESNDLYDRLREAIDRSREMYDKRVQPPVAAKFDYFHYEIVNSLADGNAERLGAGYPGSSV